jgi:hypothetical protein
VYATLADGQRLAALAIDVTPLSAARLARPVGVSYV